MVTKLMHRTKSLPSSHEYSQIRPASLRGHADGCNRAGHRSASPPPPAKVHCLDEGRPFSSTGRCFFFAIRHAGATKNYSGRRCRRAFYLSDAGRLILCSSRKKPTSRKPHTPQTHTSTPNHPAPLLFSLLLPLLRRASRHRHT